MITMEVSSGWRAAKCRDHQADSWWGATAAAQSDTGSRWQQAEASDHLTGGGWADVPHKDRTHRVQHGRARHLSPQDLTARWSDLPPTESGVRVRWDRSIKSIGVRYRLLWNPRPARKDARLVEGFRRVGDFTQRLDPEQLLQASLYRPGALLAFTFGGSSYLPSLRPSVFFDLTYRRPSVGAVPTDSGARVRHSEAQRYDRTGQVRWGSARPNNGRLTTILYPDYTGPVVIPADEIPQDPELAEAYMIGNLVTITELESGTPIQASNLRLSYDADSFSWGMSMDVLNRPSMDLIRPGSGGPGQVRIDINGHVWVMLVERYQRNLAFPRETYSVTGASRSQLLAGPYASAVSAVNAEAISANQVLDSMVLNTGFTVVWSTTNEGDVPDWVISAGALSYTSQTPMQVMAKIVASAGAILRPAKAGDILEVVPRYLAPVWEWSPLTAHKILPVNMITSLGGEWAPDPGWNSCYVSGINHGVSVMVRRTGTQGHIAAPDVLDDLMTDPGIATYRGKIELSKGGDKELVTLQLPLFPASKADAPGLVEPGMLCDVQEAGGSWIGLCLATEITASGVGASRVVQTLKLERHTSEIV